MSEDAQWVAWMEQGTADRVPVRGTCSIGRSPSNQVVLADEKVSRRHALIHAQGENEYWLVDLGSANGTYLNDRRLAQPVKLHDQDQVQIGNLRLVFRQPRGSQRGQALDHPTSTKKTLVDIKSSPCWLLVGDIEASTTLARRLPPDQLPVVTGRWFSRCKHILEETGGAINKYLGDGFLAYWLETLSNESAVVRALTELKDLQAQAQPPFRMVVHHGQVQMGGPASLGEESLMGHEVNFIFRMEKLAGTLGEARLLSEPARARLRDYLESHACGRHGLPSFDGEFWFYTF